MVWNMLKIGMEWGLACIFLLLVYYQSVLTRGKEGQSCCFSVHITLSCNQFFWGERERSCSSRSCCSFLPDLSSLAPFVFGAVLFPEILLCQHHAVTQKRDWCFEKELYCTPGSFLPAAATILQKLSQFLTLCSTWREMLPKM